MTAAEKLKRIQAIDAIRAFADWFEAHPDVPVPDSIDGNVYQHQVPERQAVPVVKRMTDEHGATLHHNGDIAWSILRINTDGPVKISHTVFAKRDVAQDVSWIA